jgi:hypothetical protein
MWMFQFYYSGLILCAQARYIADVIIDGPREFGEKDLDGMRKLKTYAYANAQDSHWWRERGEQLSDACESLTRLGLST